MIVFGRNAEPPTVQHGVSMAHASACQFAIVGGAAFLPHIRFEIESLIMLFVKKGL